MTSSQRLPCRWFPYVLLGGLLAVLLVRSAPLRADGDETLGPPRPGVLKGGQQVLAAGIGLQTFQPGKISLNVPPGFRIDQVLLYWGFRTEVGDNKALVNGATAVTGDLVGTSTAFPGADTRPFVYRADVTSLNLVKTGANLVEISGLAPSSTGWVNGAELVVLGGTDAAHELMVVDGCDFAYWMFAPPLTHTQRIRIPVTPTNSGRDGILTLVVADHLKIDKGRMRPTTLEVQVEGQANQVIDNPLTGGDGDSWDTVRRSVAIPAGARFVDVQLFSDSRTDSPYSPSSFYWLFASLEVPKAEVRALSLSGSVYCDTNGNADRDAGEPGIAGVELLLNCVLGAEVVKRSTFSGADGAYRFDGIAPGSTCTVVVVPSAALGEKEPTEECPTHEAIEADVTGCDFGYVLPPSVGDTVFCDLNGDGAQQAGEPGIAGVKVSIQVPSGGGFPGYSSSAVTDVDGKYLFKVPGVPSGGSVIATVTVDPNTGDARGKVLTTPNPQQTIPLGPGGSDLARDFGLQAEGDALVGDFIYCDDNANGLPDPGERGLPNVKVAINCPASAGFPGFTATATSDSNGHYLFTVPKIPGGKEVVCQVMVDPAFGGAAGNILTTPNPQPTVPLRAGGSDLKRDFGFMCMTMGEVRVGDTVYCDLNGNGAQDAGEPGIPGVKVTLTTPSGGGFPGAGLEQTTDAQGKYLFQVQDVPQGGSITATVTIDLTSPALAQKTLTSPNPQSTAPLQAGQSDLGRDFGLKPNAARVGDTVFCDLNGNGVQEADEPGIKGVLVRIEVMPKDGFGGLSDTAMTDANGKYLFLIEGIPPGVTVVGQVEIDPETGDAGGKELTTPNPQSTIALGAGDADLNRDFGLRREDVVVKLCVESKTIVEGACADARVLLSSSHPVEAFVSAIRHDPAILSLQAISIAGTATETNQADFVSTEVLANGGSLAVVMDLEAPFLGNTIPAGTNIPVGTYRYCCNPLPAGSGARQTSLAFVDGVLGSPPKENLVVIGGRGYSPRFCEATITCTPKANPRGPYFLCGGPRLGPDNVPEPLQGGVGERVELCFYYCSPEDNLPGHKQYDHLQGLTMALCFDCRLECIESSFRVPEDAITAAVSTEYLSFQCDNDPSDGDGCEMVLGILMDVVDPFEGQTLPPTEVPLKVGCVDVRLKESVPCGTCLPIEFCDGINGRGKVLAKNIYAAENESFPAATISCALCAIASNAFRRGDCNLDGRANLADAASIVSALFPMMPGGFQPACQDACDTNDDGRFDLADAVRLLAWLFANGAAPPAPGPTEPGQDPTSDKLICNLGCPDSSP